jgi:tetratricopeptide (TPR) repeat protein
VILAPVTETSLKEGIRLLSEGKTDVAEEAFQRAAREKPVQPEAYWWLGKIATERNEKEKAIGLYRQYAQYYPKNPRVHLLLGELHRRSGDIQAAFISFKLALLYTDRYKNALDSVNSATWEDIKNAGKPETPGEQLRLAHLFELKGRIPEAFEWAERAVSTAYPDRLANQGGPAGSAD